jgi:hypothetical protein
MDDKACLSGNPACRTCRSHGPTAPAGIHDTV